MEGSERRVYSFQVPFTFVLTPEVEQGALQVLERLLGPSEDPRARFRQFLNGQLISIVRPRLTVIDMLGMDLNVIQSSPEQLGWNADDIA